MKRILVILSMTVLLSGCIFNNDTKPKLESQNTNYDSQEEQIENNNEVDNNDNDEYVEQVTLEGFSDEMLAELDTIYIPSKFPQEDIQNFQRELDAFVLTGSMDHSTTVKYARLQEYLGYPGKALITYKKFLDEDIYGTYPVHSNMAGLYGTICRSDLEKYNEYCVRAIKKYHYVIEKYAKLPTYKDLAWLLIKMGEVKKASQVYKIYLSRGGKEDSVLKGKFK